MLIIFHVSLQVMKMRYHSKLCNTIRNYVNQAIASDAHVLMGFLCANHNYISYSENTKS